MSGEVTYPRVFADVGGDARFADDTIGFDGQLSAPPAAPLSVASLVSAFGEPAEVMLVAGVTVDEGEPAQR